MKRIIILLVVFTSFFANAQSKRKLFGLDLNPTPALDYRVPIGKVGSSSLNMTMQQLLDFTTLNLSVYSKVEVDDFFLNYLAKNNLLEYIPTLEHHPSTKGYVDSGGIIVPWAACTAATNVTLTDCKASQVGKHVYVTGKFSISTGPNDGVLLFTLPPSIGTSTIDVFSSGGLASGSASTIPIRLESNTRNVRIVGGGYSGNTYSFSISYPAI